MPPRVETNFTVRRLEAEASRLAFVHAGLVAAIEALRAEGVESVVVVGAAELDRNLTGIEAFLRGVRGAYHAHLVEESSPEASGRNRKKTEGTTPKKKTATRRKSVN